jgi:hypothetical protein
VHQRPDEPSGDYEYDLAHEAAAGSPAQRPPERPHLPPARSAELDQDMSYDEAHGF